MSESKPGDYPLGSLRSRAAARALLKEKKEKRVIHMIHFTRKQGAPMAKTPYKVSHGQYATLEYYLDEDVEDADCR